MYSRRYLLIRGLGIKDLPNGPRDALPAGGYCFDRLRTAAEGPLRWGPEEP